MISLFGNTISFFWNLPNPGNENAGVAEGAAAAAAGVAAGVPEKEKFYIY